MAKKKPVSKKNLKKAKKVVPAKKGKIEPLGDRVLVRQQESEFEKTASGILLPDSAKKEKPEKGKVVAVGAGRRSDDGKLVPLSVKVGDTVVFSKYGYDEVKIDGEDFLLIKEDHILAIINEK